MSTGEDATEILASLGNVDHGITQGFGMCDAVTEEKGVDGRLGVKLSNSICDYRGRSKLEILAKTHPMYLELLKQLEDINASDPVSGETGKLSFSP